MRYVVLANVPIFQRVGGIILSRWAHFLAGITWIGILYYFNFVQVPSFAAFDAGARTEATAKLVPRALWWFRWGAMLTLLSGISILAFQDQFRIHRTLVENRHQTAQCPGLHQRNPREPSTHNFYRYRRSQI